MKVRCVTMTVTTDDDVPDKDIRDYIKLQFGIGTVENDNEIFFGDADIAIEKVEVHE